MVTRTISSQTVASQFMLYSHPHKNSASDSFSTLALYKFIYLLTYLLNDNYLNYAMQ